MTAQMRMIANENAEITSGLATMVLVFVCSNDAMHGSIVLTVVMNKTAILIDVIVTCSDVKMVLAFHDL